MNKLVAVITGPTRNGTTYVKNVLDSHPDIFSGFETGLLLNTDFNKSKPFNEWVYEGGYHWGLPKEIKLHNGLTLNDKYVLLFHNKGSLSGPVQKMIKQSTFLVDKTPAYFESLQTFTNVLKRFNAKIPVIISIKYFKDHYYSHMVKRSDFSENQFMNEVNNYLSILRYLQLRPQTNVYIFLYDDIIKYNTKFNNKVKDIIKDRIDVNNIQLSHNNYVERVKHFQECRPYSEWTNNNNQIKLPEKYVTIEKSYNKLINRIKVRL